MVEKAIIATLLLSSASAVCLAEETDTLISQEIGEVYITASIKETTSLGKRPLSLSVMDEGEMSAKGIRSIKDIGAMIPNLFVPDYGSRQTSAMYVRGIGSRIGSPAVGLYVDNMPFYDKSAYDFTFYDIQSMEVLRGPQSTLYGRNTMGGLIRVNTRSPFDYEGTDLHLGYSTGDNRRNASLTHYHRISDRLAFSAGGFYDGSTGFFDNDITGKSVDGYESGGGRIRAIFKPSERVTMDASVHYEYTDGGAFPYYYTGATQGEEEHESLIGLISANLEGKYRRSLLTAALHTTVRTDRLSLHSVTTYQNMNDRMFMDQDFIKDDIYSLEQKQRSNIISEEITLKGIRSGNASALLGANIFYQWLDTKAPVNFRKDGVEWLNGIINGAANRYMPTVQSGPMSMKFLFADNIAGERLAFLDHFDTPTLGTSLFSQFAFHDLFGARGLSATLGLRLDYERLWMDYAGWYDFTHTYSLKGKLTMPPSMEREIVLVPEKTYQVSNHSLSGSLATDYQELLPKLALQYEFGKGKVYASVSRGFRSGGYNVQNVSELMSSQMRTDMMRDVRDATVPILQAQPTIPEDKKAELTSMLEGMAQGRPLDVRQTCQYDPEYAWNYEVGTHLDLSDGKLALDATVYLSDVHNLQLSRMSETGLGRITVNAGKSRSAGLEATLRARPTEALALTGTYGYTHATFLDYSVQDGNGTDVDCSGNHVPYMPMHTMGADAEYTFSFRNHPIHSLSLGVGCTGAGRIYWDEPNRYSQPFYALLSARVKVSLGKVDVQVWGRNLTDKGYDSFWFESMNRGYEQHGTPLQVGLDLGLRL